MKYICILLGMALIPYFVRAQHHSLPDNPEDISPLLIGEPIPAVNLTDAMGRPFSFAERIAEKPVVLVFYRGGWCPFCTRQLAGLQEVLPDLQAMGYQMWAVSTDSPEDLKASAEQNHLDYVLLSDADFNAAKLFGIAFKAPANYQDIVPILPVPAVFIVDQKGVIRFEYINPDFRQRLDAGLLLAVAKQLQADLSRD
ncbi:peroxiredoxin family protein [Parapedobacter sp.]